MGDLKVHLLLEPIVVHESDLMNLLAELILILRSFSNILIKSIFAILTKAVIRLVAQQM